MSFTVNLSDALCAAHRVRVNEADVDFIHDFGAKRLVLDSDTYTWAFSDQPIQISEEGLALVPDLKGDLQELEFFMQRPMTQEDLL